MQHQQHIIIHNKTLLKQNLYPKPEGLGFTA